ncbi:nucleolar complex-associated protein-domain-containing protein [Gongronella butleri]|nr:nucleolar complex-associated protein-domain-containing protein [Gongronella butleri]
MPPKKGSMKKTTKPPSSKAAPRPYSAPKKLAKDKEYVNVPTVQDDDLELSEEDLEFFAENQAFGSFLTGMDAKELTRQLPKKKVPAQQPISKKQQLENVPEPSDLTSSDEEDYADLADDADDFDADDALLQDLSSDDDVDDDNDINAKKSQSQLPKKMRKARVASDDEEMDYEMAPRQVSSEWTKRDYVNKLPIKLATGQLAQAEGDQLPEEESEDDNEVAAILARQKQQQQQQKEAALAEATPAKKEKLVETKEKLADLASTILEDPEEHVMSLKQFRNIYNATDSVTVKKLALVTQLAVYKDILPGYRIRPLSEQEQQVKVSKDVKKLRDFERALLLNYEMYLKELQALLSKRNVDADPSLALVATRCLCTLLTSKPHFNFRLEIMVAVVARMSTLEWNENAQLAFDAIVQLFEQDESGRYSEDAVKMMTRMIRSKGYQVHEKAVATFLHLRLKEEMRPVSGNDEPTESKKRKAKDKPFLTKKARKALKETKLIEKEFEEAEAVVSKEEKDKHHTETLKLVFAFYFRILKKQASSPLLPSVLEGLAKFAHLINVDFFNDLLNALRDVMLQLEDSKHVNRGGSGTRKRLMCAITAFELLSGQGEAINYDLKDFYREIYQILLRCTYRTALEEDQAVDGGQSESELILRSMDMMLLKKRQIPVDRLAAFVKRWALVALNMPTKSSLRCLSLVRRLLQKDQRLDALVQSEDRASTGVYQPLLQDPELCNPFGTSLYELFLYQNHYDPRIRQLAQSIQKASSSS